MSERSDDKAYQYGNQDGASGVNPDPYREGAGLTVAGRHDHAPDPDLALAAQANDIGSEITGTGRRRRCGVTASSHDLAGATGLKARPGLGRNHRRTRRRAGDLLRGD